MSQTNEKPRILEPKEENGEERPDYKIYSHEERAKKMQPPPPELVPCEFCGQLLPTAGFIMTWNGTVHWMNEPEPCDCEQAIAKAKRIQEEREAEERRQKEAERQRQLAEKVRRIIGNSGMKPRFLERTFSNFERTDTNQKAAASCYKYVQTFAEKLPKDGKNPGRNGLFITGPKGVGKTHLAAAIANNLMHRGVAVICMTMIDLLDRIKQSYNYRDRWEPDEAGILDTYKEVTLLIIDDLGKEPASEWAISKIYTIINARYEAYLPTIITTNYSDEDLLHRLTPRETGDPTTADATIDRLREMCAAIVMTGDSWRTK